MPCISYTKTSFICWWSTVRALLRSSRYGAYGATDACEPDRWQTGKDNAMDALFICLHGPELLPTLGLYASKLKSFPMLLPGLCAR